MTPPCEPVRVETAAGVTTIVIDRPAAMNAVNRQVSEGIARALGAAEADSNVRCVVLTGAGERAFSAGADLKAVAAGETIDPQDGPFADWGFAGTERRIATPVVVAVEGIAYGGGFEMVLAADVVVASRTARFALPEVRVGLFAGAGGAIRIRRALPEKVAMDMLLTGDPINAEAAHRYGLVSRLCEPGQARGEAESVARTIAANAPLAVRAAKELALKLADGRADGEQEAWMRNARAFDSILSSEDAREGALAFAQKRAPQWRGR